MDRVDQIQNTLSLLSSMIHSGERHSETSEQMRFDALKNLRELEAEPDWKAIAGTLAEALRCAGYHEACWCLMLPRDHEGHTQACKRATAALAKYEQESKA